MACEPVLSLVTPELCELERLSAPLFGGLTRAQMHQLGSFLKVETFDAGEVIFMQGDLPCNIYVILSGELELHVRCDNGDRCLERYGVGDAFGESSVIGIQAQAGTAIVASHGEAEMLVLTKEALASLQALDAEIFSVLIMNVARHLSRKHHLHLLGES